MSLYNNKKQEKEFNLQIPQKATLVDCSPLKGFVNFDCSKSYVLAQSTGDFNCIGGAIGVKDFIDPTQEINKFYTQKTVIGHLSVTFYSASSPSLIALHKYQKDSSACMAATKTFFEKYKDNSVLSKKDDYIAVDKISSPPKDDTIAFYFKDEPDEVVGINVNIKGFQHASRYVEDINIWVSDIWTSKLGEYKLMTHEEHELDGDIYGHILCYLIPEDTTCPISHPFGTALDTCPI